MTGTYEEDLYSNPFSDISPSAPAVESAVEEDTQQTQSVKADGVSLSLEFPKPENPETPTFSETTSAHFHTSLLYDFYRRSSELVLNKIDEDASYRALDDPAMSLAEPDDIGELSNSKSNAQLMRGIIDRATQRQARKTIETSGLLSNMGADLIANPWMYLLPVGEVKAAFTLGKGIAIGAGKVGAVVGAQAAAVEGAIYELEETRSGEDAAISAAAQTLVAGLIGGITGGLGSIPAKEYMRSVAASLKGYYQQFRVNEKGVVEALEVVDKSSGAQKYIGDVTNLEQGRRAAPTPPTPQGSPENPFPGRSVEGESLHQEFEFKGFGPASPFIWVGSKLARNPVLLGKTSPSLTTQAVTNDFLTSNLRLNKTAIDGITQTPSLQELMAKADAENFITTQSIKDAYARYLGVDVKPEDSRIVAGLIRVPLGKAKNKFADMGKMTEEEFNKELYRAVVTGEHDDPFISSEAARLNRESNQVISERLKEAGYSLPNSPYGAVNHLSRRYDEPGIIGDQPNKVATLKGWFSETNEQIKEIQKPINELIEKSRLSKDAGDLQAATNLDRQIRKLKQKLQDDIIQDKYDAQLLVGDKGMSWDEIQQLKSLRDPIEIAKKELRSAETKRKNMGTLKAFSGLDREKLSKLGNTYFQDAAQDIRELGRKRTLSKLVAYKSETLKSIQELKIEKKQILSSHKKWKMTGRLEGIEEELTQLEEQRIARTEVLNGLREGLKEKYISDKDFISDLEISEKSANKAQSAQNKSDLSKLRNSQQEAYSEILKARKKLQAERDKINQGVADGLIPDSLVRVTPQGNYRLRKINKGTRKLGEILTDQQLYDSAYKTFTNITRLSPDQLSNQGSSAIKRGSAGSSLTEPRVLLRQDIDLIDAGFLRTDVAQALSMKNKAASRLLVMNEWMKKVGWDGQQDQKTYLAQLVANDYKQLQQNVIDKYAKKFEKYPEKTEQLKAQQSKALNKLAKRERLDVSINETAYNRLMGTYGLKDGDTIKAMRILKKWAASTQLLANIVPTTEDFVTGIYNHGLKNYMMEGPVVYLRNLANIYKNANARVKAQIRGMGIGIESEVAVNGERINDTLGYTGPMGKIEAPLDKLAKGGQILGLAAPASDFARRINGSISVNLLIKDLQKWQAGKISRRITRRFQDGRFDPDQIIDGKRLGDLILENFNAEGEIINGGYLLNQHLWKSAAASEEVDRIVRNEVGRTIFSGNNPASFPNELDPNGIASGFFMYMGHSFSTLNNFTIPFLQNLKDPQKFQGIIAIWALASIQDPLRKMMRGEELTDDDFDPWSMTVKALQNTQLLGAVGEYFTRLNAIFDIVPSAQTNKHKWHSTLGELIMGPGGALLQNTGEVSAALINNEWNKKDQAKLPKIIPWLNMWYLRQPYQDYTEELDIPRTRANARALNED